MGFIGPMAQLCHGLQTFILAQLYRYFHAGQSFLKTCRCLNFLIVAEELKHTFRIQMRSRRKESNMPASNPRSLPRGQASEMQWLSFPLHIEDSMGLPRGIFKNEECGVLGWFAALAALKTTQQIGLFQQPDKIKRAPRNFPGGPVHLLGIRASQSSMYLSGSTFSPFTETA